MIRKLPPRLETELVEETVESIQRGRAVRFKVVLYPALLQGAMLVALALFVGVSETLVLAVVVAVSSLCVIWAIMSLSASLNAQFDLLTPIIVHYGEEFRSDRRRLEC